MNEIARIERARDTKKEEEEEIPNCCTEEIVQRCYSRISMSPLTLDGTETAKPVTKQIIDAREEDRIAR